MKSRCCFSTTGASHWIMSARRAVPYSLSHSRLAAWLSGISITTAQSMYWLPSMTALRFYYATTSVAQNHWLGINVIGKKSNPDAIGARITYQSGDLKRHRMKVGGGSFLSSHDPRMVLGIGKNTKIDWLEIRWPQPSGKVERLTDLPIDRYVTIVEGTGKWK